MSSEERRLLTTAIAELIFIDPDYLEKGVPPHKLLKAVTAKQSTHHSRKYLESIIQKELSNGGLIRMSNGNYSLGAGDQESGNTRSFNESPSKDAPSSTSSTTSSPMRVKGKPGRKKGTLNKAVSITAKCETIRDSGIRVGERRKRAKKVFDPSDNNVPCKKKRGRPVGSLNKSTLKKFSTSKDDSEDDDDDDDDETNDSQDKEHTDDHKLSAQGGICSVCRQYKSAVDNTSNLISCRDCSNKAHPSCLQGDGMLRMRPDNTWQCPHCKTCVVCVETNDAGILTVCSLCADAYHALCHTPHITERLKAWDKWECKNCQGVDRIKVSQSMDVQKASDNSSKSSEKSTSRKTTSNSEINRKNSQKTRNIDKEEQSNSPTSLEKADWKISRKILYDWKQSNKKAKENKANAEEEVSKSNAVPDDFSIYMDVHERGKFLSTQVFQKFPNEVRDDGIDAEIPDAMEWTYNDVYQYFSSYFPEQAHVFKEQEIDGRSLLMMRRNDVVKGFGLPLGLALKLYRHVVKLQARKDDFTMCWL